ncbi:MAG: hypothetical protein N4A35_06015 [Flavobacteriales bacterium]|jgi:hypothetical protein|nr:hypothetical protein [Flavobacteriales bacterium]
MKNLIILSLFLFNIHIIKAQDFEVAPVVMNFEANPGQIQKKQMTIRNHANIKQSFTFNFGDYEIDESGKKVRKAAGTSKRSCASWITVTPNLLELNPNEERTVTVLMTVPKDGYATKWGMIYVQASTEQSGNDVDKQLATGIRVTPRIAVLVSQSPKTNQNYKGKIYNLKEVTSQKDSVKTFHVVVENIGDKIFEGSVQLLLADMTTAQETKYKPKKNRVFPGEKRTFELTLPNNITPGKYVLAAILNYGHGKALEGTQLLVEIK